MTNALGLYKFKFKREFIKVYLNDAKNKNIVQQFEVKNIISLLKIFD